jgi:hypothetical protein
MRVKASDYRPASALDRRPFNAKQWLGGILGAVGAHIAIPVAFVVGAAAVAGATEEGPETYIDEHIVEARFVQLGKEPDPDKLPDRIVPRLQTAPDEATVVSEEEEPPPPEKVDAGVRPERPVEDLLTRLGDRAQAFAEIAEEREREGHPDGIPDGTETDAREGDLYAGKLMSFFKRGWTIPTTLTDVDDLMTIVEVEITHDLKVGPSKVLKSSGEPLFDQSVEDRIEQLRTLGTTLPEPPTPAVAERYLGRPLGLRFRGSDVR